MSEAPKNPFRPGELIAQFESERLKVDGWVRSIDEHLPHATYEEIQKVKRELAIYILTHDDPDPEFRRELLAEFDTCPCCQSWLGHNRPPREV
jgi:hypothetical protein